MEVVSRVFVFLYWLMTMVCLFIITNYYTVIICTTISYIPVMCMRVYKHTFLLIYHKCRINIVKHVWILHSWTFMMYTRNFIYIYTPLYVLSKHCPSLLNDGKCCTGFTKIICMFVIISFCVINVRGKNDLIIIMIYVRAIQTFFNLLL